jgi:hypothetical protein
MVVCIRLTRKFAERLNGVDLSGYSVGQIMQLPFRSAALLIFEGWAELIERRREPRRESGHPSLVRMP